MKKIICMIFAVLLILALAACGSEATEEISTVSDSSSSSPSKVIIVSKPESESSSEEASKPESTESSEEDVPVAELTNINLLTGLPTLSEKAIGKRPVAVMVNNLPDALPQYGISDADIIFEIPVEADITRLMAVYGDYTKVPDICSIRSCRYYFPILAASFDAFYVHCGFGPTLAKSTMKRLGTVRIDGSYNDYNLFARDQSRVNSGYAVEHTLVFFGTGLENALDNDDVRVELENEKRMEAFYFSEAGKETVPNGEDAKSINVYFSGYSNVDFTYNEGSGTYDKLMNGSAHMDSVTGKQLTFTNVLVLETSIGWLDDSGHKKIDVYGGSDATGYFASMGKIQKIHWEKDGDFGYLTIFDEDGNPIAINRGKTYIAFDYPDRVTYE